MKLSIDHAALVAALKVARGIAASNSTMPILECVHIACEGKAAVISASDLGTSCKVRVKATVDKPGAICVQAKTLGNMVADLSGENVELEAVEGKHVLSIKSGSFKATLAGLNPADFPKLPSPPKALSTFDAPTLVEMAGKTTYAVSHDSTRENLCGVFFEVADGLARMVSTDGHRLALVERAAVVEDWSAKGALVPAGGLTAIIKAIAEAKTCRMAIEGESIHVVVGDVFLSVRLTPAMFPPYRQIIPEKRGTFEVPREALNAVLRRVSHLRGDKTKGLLFEPKAGVMTVSIEGESGEARESLEIANPDKVECGIKLNGVYVQAVLASMDGASVKVDFGGSLEQAVFRDGENCLAIVMPQQ